MFIIAWVIESILTLLGAIYMYWKSAMNRLKGLNQKKRLPIIDRLVMRKMKQPTKTQLFIARNITKFIKRSMDYEVVQYLIICAMQKQAQRV